MSTSLPNIGVFKYAPNESDEAGYEPKTGTCAICREHITQWRHHPAASYAHTATGSFACGSKFWKIPHAQVAA